MRKTLIILFLLSSLSNAFAQTRKFVTLDDIYKKGLFASRTVFGLRSMNDGKTYVSIEHSIAGGNTTLHLYSKMTDFVLKNL